MLPREENDCSGRVRRVKNESTPLMQWFAWVVTRIGSLGRRMLMEMGVHKGYECPRVWSHSQPRSLDGKVKAATPHSEVVRHLWFDPEKVLLSFP